ncbi:hypothetical protein [Pedobacter xixiisoli]|uniref:Vitellogenin II n=1 Tax=Pedobacter xixiisoli TaxID=1476464 RepID=A0A285ZUE9_9SPHI|nr:hypothetical protein [Pedobacter xixiisoli]SOD13274.1 hypothetical protein SAMN06297358_1101 [Pedobacter xixiisoli]
MRVNHFLTSTLAAAAMLVASCSTQKMAQNNTADDVYNTTAQARVYKYSPPVQTAQIDTSRYDANYRASDESYDMDYASRIDRFYYGSPNRVYFDDYYNVYGYNSWYNPYDWSLGFNYGWGFNRWHNPYSSWAFYGSPYYWNTWGPYSYWGGGLGWGGGFGGGYWGGGYWGGGGWGGNVIVRNDNYRPRPTRGSYGNSGSNGIYNGRPVGSRGNVSNGVNRPTRAENYNPATNGMSRPDRSSGSSNSGRPTRTTESRPSTRENNAPSRPSYSPPPSNNGGSSSSGRGSSGSSGGGSSRPTRGGGRG